MGLSFSSLRAANDARNQAWSNGQKVGLAFRGLELGGEVGEALNVAKKLERDAHGWRGSKASLHDLADELADVIICADNMAMEAGIDLGAAVIHKFNATSEKNGFPHRLVDTGLPDPTPRPASQQAAQARAIQSREDALQAEVEALKAILADYGKLPSWSSPDYPAASASLMDRRRAALKGAPPMSDLGVILIIAGIGAGVLALDAFWDPGDWSRKLDAAYPTKPENQGPSHE